MTPVARPSSTETCETSTPVRIQRQHFSRIERSLELNFRFRLCKMATQNVNRHHVQVSNTARHKPNQQNAVRRNFREYHHLLTHLSDADSQNIDSANRKCSLEERGAFPKHLFREALSASKQAQAIRQHRYNQRLQDLVSPLLAMVLSAESVAPCRKRIQNNAGCLFLICVKYSHVFVHYLSRKLTDHHQVMERTLRDRIQSFRSHIY